MDKNNFDLNHSNEVLERMNKEIKETEERILKNMTPEEQEKIKKEWEQNKIKTEQKLKKEFEKFENDRKELEKRQSELIPVEKIKDGLNGMIKDLDDKWDETLQSAIEDLCKGKTEEEKEKIMIAFKNSFMNNQEK